MAAEALLEGEAEALTRKAIELAKDGDTVALRLCLDRLVPPRKDRPVTFDLGPLANPADTVSAIASIINAAASGDLTPGEATSIAALLDVYRRGLETNDLLARIEALEGKT